MDCFDTPYAFTEHLNTVNDRSEIPQWLDNALGERFMVMELLLKHWPANMYLQTPIEIAVELARDEKIDLDQVAEIILIPCPAPDALPSRGLHLRHGCGVQRPVLYRCRPGRPQCRAPVVLQGK